MKETRYMNLKQLDAYERANDEEMSELEEDFNKKKHRYERPRIEEVKIMRFMFDGLNPFKNKCRQCSSCHGCR